LIAAALACSIALACVGFAMRRWRALAQPPPRTTASTGVRNGRDRLERRAEALLGADAGVELVSAVLEAPSRAHAVAELNERLSEAQASIEAGATVPRSAARVAAASGMLMALVQIARDLPTGQGSLSWPLIAFGVGLVASGVCIQLGRLADCRAQDLRRDWNDLARALRHHLPVQDVKRAEGASQDQTGAIPDR
jgi:DNA-binding PucR family transcriptional regulator